MVEAKTGPNIPLVVLISPFGPVSDEFARGMMFKGTLTGGKWQFHGQERMPDARRSGQHPLRRAGAGEGVPGDRTIKRTLRGSYRNQPRWYPRQFSGTLAPRPEPPAKPSDLCATLGATQNRRHRPEPMQQLSEPGTLRNLPGAARTTP